MKPCLGCCSQRSCAASCSEQTLAIDPPSKTPTAFCSKGVGPRKGSILQYEAVPVNGYVGTTSLQNAQGDTILLYFYITILLYYYITVLTSWPTFRLQVYACCLQAAGGRVSDGVLWAGPIGVAMSRAFGRPRWG